MFGRWRNPERKKHVRGMLRASAYFATVGLACGIFQLRNARAEVRNQTLEMGRQMFRLANGVQHDVTKATLNGQAMWVGSSLSTDSVGAVLDRYEEHCKMNAAQPIESWRELAAQAEAGKGTGSMLDNFGVLRSGDDREGSVACFTRGNQSKPTVTEALRVFGETGELGALGNLRYVYVKKGKSGGAVVLTAWTDNAFNLRQFAPKPGEEVAGEDFSEVPRPPDSHRVFAVTLEGTPFGVNVYATTSSAPADILAFYDKTLVTAGWRAIDPGAEAFMNEDMKQRGALVRLYSRDAVVLTLSAHREGAQTMAGLGIAGVDPGEDGRGSAPVDDGARRERSGGF